MIFKSNLTCPDLMPNFKHLISKPMGHSFGHDVPSDWGDKSDDDPVFGIYKRCGMWTHDEAAILAGVSGSSFKIRGVWVDIGAHTGWTSQHINQGTNSTVICVEPMLQVYDFRKRFKENWPTVRQSWLQPQGSNDYFGRLGEAEKARGFVIDGCHEPGQPLQDAMNAEKHLHSCGVIMLHDGTGRPTREAVEYLMAAGFKARAYFTPHLVFCCWRGDITPPDHEPDPLVKAAHLDGRYPDFDFRRMS